MKKYTEINESVNLGGKASFDIFLDIIAELKMLFIKYDFYNVGEYNYFFTTEKIKDNYLVVDMLKRKRSLNHAYLTLSEIRDMRLSFYFGVKKKTLFYGFYNEDTKYVYKVGLFSVTTSYLKKIKTYSLKNIKDVLSNVDLLKINKLHDIKKDFETFLDVVDIDIKIKDKFILSKQFTHDMFKTEDITELNMNYTLLTWSRKFKWFNSVYTFVNVTDKYIYFYIKLKGDELYE